MALTGFMVSVREALLYRPAIAPKYQGVSFEALVRTNAQGLPVFYPGLPKFVWNSLGTVGDPDDQEAGDDQERWNEWEEAEPNSELIDEGDEGREIRDVSSMTDDELKMLRTSAVFGTVGTFVWAFGDLLGGIPAP